MERIKKTELPNAILTSDWHLREDQPVCRTDSYWNSMWKKVDFISNLQKKYDCVVLHGGDLFDKARPSLNLVRETMDHIPNKFYTVYGQHDLVNHSLDLTNKCGINVLWTAEKLTVLKSCHWGQEPDGYNCFPWYEQEPMKKVLVWHKMVWQGKLPYPGCPDAPASTVIKKYNYDLLLFGDNHKTFVERYEGRILVNPGSLMRMDADQVDHKPCVFLWYAETNTVEQVFLPIEEGVVSRTHLVEKEERDGRIDAFISRLNSEYTTNISFEDNLESFFKANNIDSEVKSIIYKSIEA